MSAIALAPVMAGSVVTQSAAPQTAAPPAAATGLASVFLTGSGSLRDTNGDGWPDDIAARVIVPASPTAGDIQAATNIAARLGFETMAATLPIVVRDSDLPKAGPVGFAILVGRDNAIVRRLAGAGVVDLASLEPGQGLIAAVPSPLGPAGPHGIVVAGADDEGTVAAGVELAARLPRLWSMTGISLGAIEEQTAAYLRAKDVAVSSAFVTSLIVDRERRGIASVRVRVAVAGKDAAAKGTAALQALEAAHRRGLEPRTLNFTNAAETRIDFVAASTTSAPSPANVSGAAANSGAPAARTPTGLAAGHPLGHAIVRRAGLNARTLTPPIDPDELAPDSPGERGRPAEGPAAGSAKTFDLTDLYSLDGWLGDAYTDLIPDRTDTVIVPGLEADALAAAHIAARIGLETTGITLPLTKTADKVREPAREPSPILVGRNHPLVDDLVKVGKVSLTDLSAGEGLVQTVPRAFGNATATVAIGADARGTEAASLYLARRAPYVWDNTRGSIALGDVANDVSRFLQARTGAGQVSQMIGELDDWLDELKALAKDKPNAAIESIDAKLFVESGDAKLDQFIAGRIKSAIKGPAVNVVSQGITDPVPVFEETVDVPWEVDEFKDRFRKDVLARVSAANGANVELEARLSESPEVRKALAEEVRAELTKAGAANPRVRILSAYKQGFLWLSEEIVPSLKGKNVRTIRIQVARQEPDLRKKYKFYEVPTRWMHELYPIDEIFARDLGIGTDAFHLELVDAAKGTDTYTLEALDANGARVLKTSFTPKSVEREYLEKFPGWSRVTVTTGWIAASINGASVVDARIATDPERFWDHYQAKVLPRIYDHVMKVTDNRPLPDKQPFYRDLDVEVRMSEPDFRIGVDEELISSLESLHEDLYFVTLDFFDALGRTTVRRRIGGPGKIYPIIHPERAGRPGQVRILYAGNAATKPKLELSYKEKGQEKPVKATREISKIEVVGDAAATPRVLRAVVTPDAIKELELSIDVKDDRDAARAADAWDALAKLHAAGLYRTTLSYDRVGMLALAIATKETRTRRTLAHSGTFTPSPVHRPAPTSPADRTTSNQKPPRPLIAWDHVISPEESERLVAQLAAYPEIAAFRAGRSYRGRDTSVMEVTLPSGGELVSLAKSTTFKPTIFITGRQHANEVSSTSHILRLAEMLATDPAYRDVLKKVNVVLHPVENPDGAAMAYELQKLTPTHMLHAGRYSALGMDVASQVGLPDPLLPESLVRTKVWRDWLPDIYLNPHGYPSHEWVQQFAGYVPPGFRSYWSSRGWWTQMSALRDPRYPEHARVAETIREQIVREVNSYPDVRAMNLRHQARYRRWAFGFAPNVFNQEIYKDTAIYFTDPESGQPTGSRRAGARGTGDGGPGRDVMAAYPQVTYFNGMTESPDETAQGAWLDLVTKPGFGFLMASIRYLQHGEFDVQRLEENGPRDAAAITLFRPRPVRPGRTAADPTASR